MPVVGSTADYTVASPLDDDLKRVRPSYLYWLFPAELSLLS